MTRPNAACIKHYIEPKNYDEIRAQMLRTPEPYYGEPGVLDPGTSFAGQMQLVHDGQQTPHFLVTALSAIPVADAIRGYYEELGEPTPPIDIVNSNRFLSSGPIVEASQLIEEETERLGKLLGSQYAPGNMPNVVVIDQYVNSGGTLAAAVKMARAAGAKSARRVRGDWWGSARPTEVVQGTVTSIHADFMHDVGRLAAQTHFDNLEGLFD